MINETSFTDMRRGEGREKAINSDATLVHFNRSGSRAIGESFLMIKVTRVERSAIEELAAASLKAVDAVKGE